jgi:acylphosphatase
MAVGGFRRVHGRVSGEVQGVGFRAFVRRTAQGLGLSGWVRNNWDGTVEFQAEGPPEIVDDLLGHLRRGPPMAEISGIEIVADTCVETEATGPFEIRY